VEKFKGDEMGAFVSHEMASYSFLFLTPPLPPLPRFADNRIPPPKYPPLETKTSQLLCSHFPPPLFLFSLPDYFPFFKPRVLIELVPPPLIWVSKE